MTRWLVFICHDHRDDSKADELIAALEAVGVPRDRVFADHAGAIAFGEDRQEAIDAAFHEAPVIAVLVSDAFFCSEPAKHEAHRAYDPWKTGNKRLVPIWIATPEEAHKKGLYLFSIWGPRWSEGADAVARAVTDKLPARSGAAAPAPGEVYRVVSADGRWVASPVEVQRALDSACAYWLRKARRPSGGYPEWHLAVHGFPGWCEGGVVTAEDVAALRLSFHPPPAPGPLFAEHCLCRLVLCAALLARTALASNMAPRSPISVSFTPSPGTLWAVDEAVNWGFRPGMEPQPACARPIAAVARMKPLSDEPNHGAFRNECYRLWKQLIYAWEWTWGPEVGGGSEPFRLDPHYAQRLYSKFFGWCMH